MGMTLGRGRSLRPSLVQLRRVQNRVSPTLLCPTLRLAETVSDSSLSRPNWISLYRERVGILHLRVFYITLVPHQVTSERTVSLREVDLGSDNSSPATNTSHSVEYSSTNNFVESKHMENNDRTIKELATPDMVYQPWCIQYPQLEPAQSYEQKSDLIHLFPKFHLAREDPHKYLKEFHVSILFNTWGDMKHMFLEKFFLVSKTITIKKEICGIRQHSRETLHEYWERFNKLCATCLTMMDGSIIDTASGGALMDKTPIAARHLISNTASNTQ
ncbi:hypothetical protein CR513_38151, partial [Mucuna pruriens]